MMMTVLDIVAEHVPNLEALNLESNKLQNIERLSILSNKFSKLKILSIGNNKVNTTKICIICIIDIMFDFTELIAYSRSEIFVN